MKVKTSVTISQELLHVMDEFLDADKNRSLFLEKAAWAYIAKLRRAQRDAQDIEIINQRAEYLNAEVLDSLAYQVTV
jgi:metal-responsive CopG/Arc/MetJ family transcriptional regulator